MVVNFKARGSSRDAHKLAQTTTLYIYIKKITKSSYGMNIIFGYRDGCGDKTRYSMSKQ